MSSCPKCNEPVTWAVLCPGCGQWIGADLRTGQGWLKLAACLLVAVVGISAVWYLTRSDVAGVLGTDYAAEQQQAADQLADVERQMKALESP